MKLICIGLPKTGTTSLAHSLTERGMTIAHGPYPIALNEKTQDEQFDELDKFDALLEFYGLWDLKDVVERWPDAIVLCTHRNKEDWTNSCRRHFRPSPSERVRRGRQRRFGVPKFNADTFDRLHYKHSLECMMLIGFGVKIRNLYLVGGDTTETLNRILDQPAGTSFPHKRRGRRR